MIIKSDFLGRVLVVKENNNWCGYGINANGDTIGCNIIAPSTCKSLHEVFLFVKEHISSSVIIEKFFKEGNVGC